jgi:hypothetical protein
VGGPDQIGMSRIRRLASVGWHPSGGIRVAAGAYRRLPRRDGRPHRESRLSNQPPADPNEPWKKPEDPHAQPSPDAPATPGETAPQPPRPPDGPAFKPGYASLPQPPTAKPLPPTSMFPQQPYSAPSQPGGYPPPPDPSQPYPPPVPAGSSPYSDPSAYQQPYSSPPVQGYVGQPGYPGQGYAGQPGYADQQGYIPQQGTAPQGGYGAQAGGYPPPPPGYGPPGYGQPGYGRPPRPPKRSKLPFVALGIVVLLLLCAGGITAGVVAFHKAADKAQEALKPITDLPATGDPDPLPTDVPTQPTDDPGQPGSTGDGKTITVVYEVTGDGPASIIYTDKLGETPQRVENATLPWTHTTTMDGTALLSVTGIRTGTDDGSISCRATVDGQEVVQRTNTGSFATASCIKFIF